MEQLKIDSPESHDLHPPDQDDHEEEEEQLLNLTPEILSSSVLSHPGDSEPFDVFICSEAGKPIYSYNKERDEEFVVTLMPLMTAMINFFRDGQKEDLKSVTSAGGLRITFSLKPPLILVLVTHLLSALDPVLLITQLYAGIISILTLKTLKSVFDQRSAYDLRRLLGGSEKLIDTLIDEGLLKNQLCLRRNIRFDPVCGGDGNDVQTASGSAPLIQAFLTSFPPTPQPGRLSNGVSSGQSPLTAGGFSIQGISGRSLVPVLPLSPATRESVTNALTSSVTSCESSILFALLFQRNLYHSANEVLPGSESVVRSNCNAGHIFDFESNLLITVHNNQPKQAKLNPLDIQLLSTLIAASEGQLASAESLWLPVCIPRVDSQAFIHGHISYLTQSGVTSPATDSASHIQKKLCLFLLAMDREDFNKCQHVRDTLSERLNKVRIIASPFTELLIPQLQMFCYFSVRPHCMMYRNLPFVEQTHFNRLVNYVSARMTSSGFKTFWLQSDDHHVTLLGWHSPSFTLYFQFDVTVSPGEALAAASSVVKWIKKEEEKVKLKDYQ
jgi:hypothetical protein